MANDDNINSVGVNHRITKFLIFAIIASGIIGIMIYLAGVEWDEKNVEVTQPELPTISTERAKFSPIFPAMYTTTTPSTPATIKVLLASLVTLDNVKLIIIYKGQNRNNNKNYYYYIPDFIYY